MSDKYYTLTSKNTSSVSVPLRLSETLSVPFLINPSEYSLSVVRYVLPNYETPIFIFPDGALKLSMSYKTASVTENVIFENRSNVANNYVYEVQHLIDMLNTTINTARVALNALETLPSADNPYFIYDNVTHLISFICKKTEYTETVTNPIRMYLNTRLFKMLQGMPTISTGVANKEFQILCQEANNNTYATGFWQVEQQACSFENMCDFNSIVLTTTMPVNPEYVGKDIATPIITDYCPVDLTVTNFHNKIIFNTVFPYRQTKFLSDAPLYNITVNGYWADVSGNLHELYVPPNDSANVKMMFIKN